MAHRRGNGDTVVNHRSGNVRRLLRHHCSHCEGEQLGNPRRGVNGKLVDVGVEQVRSLSSILHRLQYLLAPQSVAKGVVIAETMDPIDY